MTMLRRAFTIIELLAVLVLMALLAGSAVYAFGFELRSARLADASGQIRDLDQMTRRLASGTGAPTSMVIQPYKGRLFRRDLSGRTSQPVALSRRIRIDRVLVAGHEATRSDVRIDFMKDGSSSSYALRLSAPDQTPRWIVVAGLGGEVTQTSDDKQVEHIFAVLARAARNDPY
jgi:prepilin-type N-terminal cleavage/methylation domain-containing protein